MGIGGCIGLIGLGAILTFAVDLHVKGLDIGLIGVIMMVVGVIGLAAYVSVYRRGDTHVVDIEDHQL